MDIGMRIEILSPLHICFEESNIENFLIYYLFSLKLLLDRVSYPLRILAIPNMYIIWLKFDEWWIWLFQVHQKIRTTLAAASPCLLCWPFCIQFHRRLNLFMPVLCIYVLLCVFLCFSTSQYAECWWQILFNSLSLLFWNLILEIFFGVSKIFETYMNTTLRCFRLIS